MAWRDVTVAGGGGRLIPVNRQPLAGPVAASCRQARQYIVANRPPMLQLFMLASGGNVQAERK